ncbi:MAG: hypothetical protein NTU53_20350 [Planctomycetota bacterium]|nr:hypothetical protein [Planctomycetota bacterium]
MKTRWQIFVLVSASMLIGSWGAYGAEGPTTRPGNGALKYWQAFAVLPNEEEDRAGAEQWKEMGLGEHTQQLVGKLRPSLKMLRQGAGMRGCDWGVDLDEGPEGYLPHLSKCRQLSQSALLAVRCDFAAFGDGEAADNLAAVFALGRHVGSDPIMISKLVECAIVNDAIDQAAEHMGIFTPEVVKQLMARLDALPASVSLADCVRGEKRAVVDWLRRELEQPGGRGVENALGIFGAEQAMPAGLAQVLGDPGKRAKALAELAAYYDRLAVEMARPNDPGLLDQATIQEKQAKAGVLVQTIAGAMDRVYGAEARMRVKLAMLKAAAAVVLEGPESLKRTADPFGAGSFEYRKLQKGFELKSKLEFDGKPVVLIVGQDRK